MNLWLLNGFKEYDLPGWASVFLFLSMLGNWISFVKEQGPHDRFNIVKMRAVAQFLLFFSNILFGLTLALRWVKEGYFPLSNLYESLIFLAWCISLIGFLFERNVGSRLVTLVLTPVVLFISTFSSFTLPIELQKALPLVPSLQSNWLMMHVSMMMVSYASLLVGSLFALFYLSFDIYSKTRRSFFVIGQKYSQSFNESYQPVYRDEENGKSLLENLDIWSYQIISLGFPFLTLGIISGAVWANEAWGSYWSWDPKETWALITWLIFAIYLHSRIVKGWQGRKAAIVGSFGFFVIWICYLGVNFLATGLHTYGWILK